MIICLKGKNDYFFSYVQYIFMNSFLIPIAKSRGHGVINMDLLYHNNDFVPSSVEFWPCDFGVDDENLKSLEYQKFLSRELTSYLIFWEAGRVSGFDHATNQVHIPGNFL